MSDGWNESVTGSCEDFFTDVERVAYEVRNCVRGCYTNVTTNQELAEVFRKLSEEALEVADIIECDCEEQKDDEYDTTVDNLTESLSNLKNELKEREITDKRKLEYCFNENRACAMRGAEADKPNKTVKKFVSSEVAAVKHILKHVFHEDLQDWIEDNDFEATLDDLIEYATEQDITGGFPILFWLEFDGERMETAFSGMEDEFNCDEEDDDWDEDEKPTKSARKGGGIWYFWEDFPGFEELLKRDPSMRSCDFAEIMLKYMNTSSEAYRKFYSYLLLNMDDTEDDIHFYVQKHMSEWKDLWDEAQKECKD